MNALPKLLGIAGTPPGQEKNGTVKTSNPVVGKRPGKADGTKRREKRESQRQHCQGPVWLTRLNTNDWNEAQASNLCEEGMCCTSNTFFKAHTILLLRVRTEGWDFTGVDNTKGLRTVTLGEVRWCQEARPAAPYGYEFGVRYVAPVY